MISTTPAEHAPPVVLPPKTDGPRLPPHLAPRFSDTSPEAEAVLVEMLRKLTDEERYRRAAELTDFVINQSKQAIERAHPEWSQRERDIFFVRLCYGDRLADEFADHLSRRPS